MPAQGVCNKPDQNKNLLCLCFCYCCCCLYLITCIKKAFFRSDPESVVSEIRFGSNFSRELKQDPVKPIWILTMPISHSNIDQWNFKFRINYGGTLFLQGSQSNFRFSRFLSLKPPGLPNGPHQNPPFISTPLLSETLSPLVTISKTGELLGML